MIKSLSLAVISLVLCGIAPMAMAQNGQEGATPQQGGIVYPGDNPFGYDPVRSKLHQILSKFWLSVSTGQYRSTYDHDLPNYAVLQQNGVTYIIPQGSLDPNGANAATTNWYTFPTTDSVTVTAADGLVSSDTATVSYDAAGRGVPLDINLRYQYQRFRIGAGISFEFHKFRPATPSVGADVLGTFTPIPSKTTIRRVYLLLGYDILDYRLYGLVGDIRIAAVNLGKGFDQTLVQNGISLNVGLSYERKFSEIFRAFARVGVEVKNYSVTLPAEDLSINNSNLSINLGLSFSFPHLPRCPAKGCTTQIDHAHAGAAYRSRMHPFWKWQNPHYGENNPKLIMHKRKNRRKIWSY